MNGIARVWLNGVVLLLGLMSAVSASAEPLEFEGSLEIDVLAGGAVAATGTGVADVASSGGQIFQLSFPAGVLSGSAITLPVTDPSAFPIAGIQATLSNSSAAFSRIDSAAPLAGPMGVRGVQKLCLFITCNGQPPANISVPLSVIGVGGTVTANVLINVTVEGAPWTTGTVAVQGPDGTISTAGGTTTGGLQLVTPIRISSNIAALSQIPGLGRLGIQAIVPACDDLLDNDGDGLVDFPNDPGCDSADDAFETSEDLVCDDGTDNDGDGAVDFPADPGCDEPLDGSEKSDTIECDDGEDNDGDFFADLLDPGCDGPADASEKVEGIECDDGIDNDGDGRTDFPRDFSCLDPTDPIEEDELDGDGVRDSRDNCLGLANPDQADADQDGYGSLCDADFDNDGGVGISDFNILRPQFGLTDASPLFDPVVDMNGDGAIGIPEFNLLRRAFGGPPGPSGLDCAGTVPCP